MSRILIYLQYYTTERRRCSCNYSVITTYLPFTEEVIVGFTVDANVGFTLVSVVEMRAVVTCDVFTNCGTERIAADVNDTAV